MSKVFFLSFFIFLGAQLMAAESECESSHSTTWPLQHEIFESESCGDDESVSQELQVPEGIRVFPQGCFSAPKGLQKALKLGNQEYQKLWRTAESHLESIYQNKKVNRGYFITWDFRTQKVKTIVIVRSGRDKLCAMRAVIAKRKKEEQKKVQELSVLFNGCTLVSHQEALTLGQTFLEGLKELSIGNDEPQEV